MFDKNKIYFLDEDGRSYYIDSSGNVQKSATPKPLELTPEANKSISIGYERSIVDHELGNVRTFSLPSDFVRNAGKILKWITYTLGFGEKVYLLIQQLQVTVNLLAGLFRMQYQYVYKGQIDFTSFIDKDTRTTITISEGGIAKQIKGKDSTTLEIDLDSDPEVVLIKDDGINLYDTAHFIVTPIDQKTVIGAGVGRYLPAAMTTRDGSAAGFAGFQNTGTDTYNEPPPIEQAHFATSQVITGMRIKGKITVEIDFNASYDPSSEKIVFQLNSNLRQGSAFNTPGITYLNPNGKTGEPIHNHQNIVTFDFDVRIDTQPNEYFFIWSYGPPFNNLVTKFEFTQTEFTIEFHSQYKTTYIKGLKLSTVGKRLIKKITGSEDNIDTTFLQQYDNLILTSGDGIRGLSGAKIKTSLKDYKDFVWIQCAGSRGIENGKLIFADFSHFLKTDNPIQLSEVAKMQVYAANDLICNSIKAGYPVQQIDDINGKYSFHNTLYFSIPIDLEEPKALDLISPYIACPFYQEIIRINLEGKTTVDDQGDNTVMVMDCRPTSEILNGNTITIGSDATGNYFQAAGLNDKIDLFKVRFTVSGTASNDNAYSVKSVVDNGTSITVYVNENIVAESVASAQFSIEYYTFYRPAYSAFSGVPEIATLYNIELSPKSIMLKHQKWINSICYPMFGKKITYESTEKNADFERSLNGVIVKEKSAITIGSDIWFKPFYFEFDTAVPVTTISDLDADINRCFEPLWYSDSYKGFSRKIGASTNENKSQQFKLLCAPETDLTNLIS